VTTSVLKEPRASDVISWPVLIVLASLAAVAPISTDLYLPGFPDLGHDFDVSASVVQLTLTVFLMGLACGQLVMGPLSDRYGRRWWPAPRSAPSPASSRLRRPPSRCSSFLALWAGSPAQAAWSSVARSSPTSPPAEPPPRRSR
jgi:MFS family permease